MKKIVGILVLISVISVACKKSSVKPENTTVNTSAGNTTGQSTSNSTTVVDSANNVKGSVSLQLAKDSINSDNISINFDPNSQAAYTPGMDAPTFQGFGQVSLSSISSNNIPLSIYTLPLSPKGLKISLSVSAQSDGIYSLNLKGLRSVPRVYDLWLMDCYKKDSVELRYNHNYAFNIYKADTSSFGKNRFKLVIRTH